MIQLKENDKSPKSEQRLQSPSKCPNTTVTSVTKITNDTFNVAVEMNSSHNTHNDQDRLNETKHKNGVSVFNEKLHRLVYL